MAFKNINEINPQVVIEKGQSIQGIYKGNKECTSKKGKTFIVHQIEIDGIEHDLMGCGALDHQFAKVQSDAVVRVSYYGTKNVEGTMMHNYNVAVWED